MKTQSNSRHRQALLCMGVLLAMVLALLGPATTSVMATGSVNGYFSGYAFGTYARSQAGPIANTNGRSAHIALGCAGTRGNLRSNTVDTLSAGRVLSAQQIYTTVYSDKTDTEATARNTSKVEGLSLLDGLITATAVEAVATTTADASTIRGSAEGSTFVDLQIDGVSIEADIEANTQLTLDGFGYVILKEVKQYGDGTNRSQIIVTMIHVVITQENRLNLPIGTEIEVAYAESGFRRAPFSVALYGKAYAADSVSSSLDIENRIGELAVVGVGCEGSGGETKSNTIDSVSVDNILSIETGTTTAYGDNLSTGAVVRTTATAEGVSLLDGLIQADLVKAVAESSAGAHKPTSSTEGSTFVNLRIAGVTVDANVAPNTRVELPGLGYVVLYERSLLNGSSRTEARVKMIHVFITTENLLGLPVGTEIVVSSALTTATPF
ncbi:MAG: hypothetical protein M3220_08520 [Chloroflexota bacterium]|nr:hypothetical protein [Chloroflexota bacterium]